MRRLEDMKRQHVDVVSGNNKSFCVDDSGNLVNPFMRVTDQMTRHLATLRVSSEFRRSPVPV